MRSQQWMLVGLSLVCTLGAEACISPVESVDDSQQSAAPREAEEATGEVAQELGFSPAAFPFRIDVRDNGKGKAGGWQKTSPVLSFADTREVFSPKYWNCAITVGMPIRAELVGVVSPVYASQITAQIATDVSGPLLHSRPEWLSADYCRLFIDGMNAMFLERYPTLGTRVSS